MTQMVDATTDPQLANALVAGALSNEESTPAAVPQPKITPPHDRTVTLFAGIVNPIMGTAEQDAVVRELTGVDEEALTTPTLVKSAAKYLAALVQRGTESIGGQAPSKEQLGGLLIGDREKLVVAIRRATYGPTLDGLVTICPFCGDRDDEYALDLDDIPVKELENVQEAIYGFQVELPSSGVTALVRLPTAAEQDAILEATGKKSEGELNTLMLGRVVQSLGDQQVYSDQQVRGLPIRDRRTIMDALDEKAPGVLIGEVKRTCGACEKEFGLGLGLLDIFRP